MVKLAQNLGMRASPVGVSRAERWRGCVGLVLGELLELDDLVDLRAHRNVGHALEDHFDDHRDPMLLHPGPRLLKSGLDAVRLGDADRLAAKAFGDLDVIHAVAVALRSIRPVETPAWLSERRPV